MIFLTSVKSSSIAKKIRSIVATLFGPDDAKEAPEVAPFGFDGAPLPGLTAVFIKTNKKGATAFIGYINKNQLADTGEVRIYSMRNSTDEAAKIWLHSNGDVEIAGTSDTVNPNHAAQYEGLQTAFDQLKSDFNDHITLFNLHVHSGGTLSGGLTGVPGSTGTPSSADISPAKIDKILVP